ncbi:MAG: membrane protein insertion efficiency factor YidD [Clostridia bacterium]|nr:membrane protein insertion efficiency factor YidD [Clostridia bacterium]
MWTKILFYPLQLIFAFFIWVYRIFISPLLPNVCKFTPSCSVYAITALKKFGAFRGSLLAIRRISRCRPGTKGGFDPVPQNIKGDSKWIV